MKISKRGPALIAMILASFLGAAMAIKVPIIIIVGSGAVLVFALALAAGISALWSP